MGGVSMKHREDAQKCRVLGFILDVEKFQIVM